jgi:hypothetical protein
MLNSKSSKETTVLNFKFRLYPTKEQELALEQTLDDCRWVYNSTLNHLYGLNLMPAGGALEI